MGPGLLITLLAAATLLLVVCVGLMRSRRANRRLGGRLDALQARLDALEVSTGSTTGGTGSPTRGRGSTSAAEEPPDYVITTAGMPALREQSHPHPRPPAPAPFSARDFASVALGESLVTVLALGHGVRRALSAENRNRIGFEIRREVRRSRRQRKRDVKEARRHLRETRRVEDAA